ncbi:MAG: hypothetical protein WBB34_10700 [Xanthobacteraceae bacterium]
MTDAGLWLILIATLAIVPVGCVLTRPKKITPDQKEHAPPVAE